MFWQRIVFKYNDLGYLTVLHTFYHSGQSCITQDELCQNQEKDTISHLVKMQPREFSCSAVQYNITWNSTPLNPRNTDGKVSDIRLANTPRTITYEDNLYQSILNTGFQSTVTCDMPTYPLPLFQKHYIWSFSAFVFYLFYKSSASL